MAETHLRTTLRADAHRCGAGADVVSPTPSPSAPSVVTPSHCLPHLTVGVGGTVPLRCPPPPSRPRAPTPYPPCEQLLAAVVVSLAGLVVALDTGAHASSSSVFVVPGKRSVSGIPYGPPNVSPARR